MWLITGGTGLVGRALVRSLIQDNVPVVLLVRKRKRLKTIFQDESNFFTNTLSAKVVLGDLGHLDNLIPHLDSIQGVIHLAATLTAHNQAAFLDTNFRGTQRLHKRLFSHNKALRWIQVSSLAANGPVPFTSEGLDPRFDQNMPISHYGQSKLLADSYLKDVHPSDQLAIVRPGIVFGDEDQAWLPFLKLINKGIEPKWRGAVMPYFSMIDVNHLVHVLRKLMGTPLNQIETLYPAFEKPMHWDQMFNVWKTSLELHSGVKHSTIKLPITPILLKGLGSIFSLLGIVPGLSRTLSASGDKFYEMAAHHWAKDGYSQMADLGLSMPKSGEKHWQACIQSWQNKGWV